MGGKLKKKKDGKNGKVKGKKNGEKKREVKAKG